MSSLITLWILLSIRIKFVE